MEQSPFEKLTGFASSQNFPAFMEPESPLPYSLQFSQPPVTILLGGVWCWVLLGVLLGVQGWSFSYLRGRKQVDENILCVAWLYWCVGVLGGICLFWVVVEYLCAVGCPLSSGVSWLSVPLLIRVRDTCGSRVHYSICCGCVMSSYRCSVTSLSLCCKM
jgi:hypothetical protein